MCYEPPPAADAGTVIGGPIASRTPWDWDTAPVCDGGWGGLDLGPTVCGGDWGPDPLGTGVTPLIDAVPGLGDLFADDPMPDLSEWIAY